MYVNHENPKGEFLTLPRFDVYPHELHGSTRSGRTSIFSCVGELKAKGSIPRRGSKKHEKTMGKYPWNIWIEWKIDGKSTGKTTDTQFFRENLWKTQGNQRKLIQRDG